MIFSDKPIDPKLPKGLSYRETMNGIIAAGRTRPE